MEIYTHKLNLYLKTAAFSDKESIVNQRGHLSDPPLLVNVDLSSWELTHIFQLSEQCGKKEIWTDFYRFPQDFRKGKGQQRAVLWSTEVAEPHTVGLKPPTSGVGAVTGMEGATLSPASGRRCSAGEGGHV